MRPSPRSFDDVPGRLRPGGAVLLFFGTSGDVEYLDERISANRTTERHGGRADHHRERRADDILRPTSDDQLSRVPVEPAGSTTVRPIQSVADRRVGRQPNPM